MSAAPISDAQLGHELMSGSLDAFEHFVDLYYTKVFQYSFAMCGQREDAEEIAQETLMKVLRSLVAIAVFALVSNAQVPAPRDEEFDLNIDQEHIVKANFARSTSAVVQDDKVRLEAGAAVSAGRIDITVRGAYGHVRFRANLDALDRLFRRP